MNEISEYIRCVARRRVAVSARGHQEGEQEPHAPQPVSHMHSRIHPHAPTVLVPRTASTAVFASGEKARKCAGAPGWLTGST